MPPMVWPSETALLERVWAEAEARGERLPKGPALWWPWGSTVARTVPAAVPAARLLPWSEVSAQEPMVVLPLGVHQRTLLLALQPQGAEDSAWEIDWHAWTPP